MLRFSGNRALILLILIFCASCGGRIPDGPGKGKAKKYEGSPAAPRPLPPKSVRQHPLLSVVSSIHSDSYNSDVDDFAGPLGINPTVRTRFIGMCAIIMFDNEGMIKAVCLDPEVIGLGIAAIDPATMKVINRYAIPIDFNRVLQGGQGDQGVSVNGAYFHIDNRGRALVGTQDNFFLELELREDAEKKQRWDVVRSIDLNPHLSEGDFLIDTQYDWSGNVWFASSNGAVGYINGRDLSVRKIQLDSEFIENGIAVSEDGVFVLTSEAAYRFEINEASLAPRHTWRVAYDRGTVTKPGTFALGSGATPTLLGDDLITFTDNADSQVNLLVLRRARDVEGDRLVCKVLLFEPGKSAVDVSMIGYNNSIVVENIYNAGSFLADYRDLAPGLTRVDVRDDRSGCDLVWTSNIRSTTVPKLSTKTGLIYTYTQDLYLPEPVDAWYLTAVSFETGQVVYRVLTGTGKLKANAFGGIAIGPDGAVYQGVVGGIVSVRDGG